MRGQMLRTGSSQDLKNRSEGGAKYDALTLEVYGLCLFLLAQISDTFPRRRGNYNFAYFSVIGDFDEYSTHGFCAQ